MEVIETSKKIQQLALHSRAQGEKLVFVPTMGALHRGHLELLSIGKNLGTKLILSIFVNPTQFGPNEDFAKYPRNLPNDLELAKNTGVDIVFTPSVTDIYPPGDQTAVEVGEKSKRLCGTFRPGHFAGVATVVLKLFNIVQPHVAIFGEKDYQQLQIIRQMVADFQMPIDIFGAPTIRENDGLALSSRNKYLSANERAQALAIPKALNAAKFMRQNQGKIAPEQIEISVRSNLLDSGFTNEQIQYASVVDAETLNPITDFSAPARLCVAAYVGKTRLIDNIAL